MKAISLARQRANQAPKRRRAACTRAQGQFAHATTLGAPTIVVTQAKQALYKNICASEPENVCTLLAASPAKAACLHSVLAVSLNAPTIDPHCNAYQACTLSIADQSQTPKPPPPQSKTAPAARHSTHPHQAETQGRRARVMALCGRTRWRLRAGPGV